MAGKIGFGEEGLWILVAVGKVGVGTGEVLNSRFRKGFRGCQWADGMEDFYGEFTEFATDYGGRRDFLVRPAITDRQSP